MKNVLIVGITPPLLGGSQNHIYEIVSRMTAKNKITVLTQKNSDFKKIKEINCIELSTPKPTLWRNLFFFIKSLFVILALKKGKYDIIHFHESYFFPIIPFVKNKAEIIATVHGCKGFKYYDNPFLRAIFLNALGFARQIITPGYEERKILLKYNSNVEYIPNGVSFAKFGISKVSKKKIVFFGRMHPQKGIIYLIDAFKHIQKDHPEYSLILVGKKNAYALMLEKHAKDNAIKNIEFTDFLPDEELIKHLATSYAVIMPSLWDVSGTLVLFEALASGKPVVTTKLPSIDQIVKDQENVLLVEPKDEKMLAEAITYLIKNPKKAKTIGSAGKRLAKRYDWSELARKTSKIYGKVIDG